MATFTHPRVSRGMRRVSTIGIGSLTRVIRRGILESARGILRSAMGISRNSDGTGIDTRGHTTGAGNGRRLIIFRIIRRVPRCPNNVGTLCGCLRGGAGDSSIGKGTKNDIVINFAMSRDKGMGSIQTLRSSRPVLAGRTREVIDRVPT